MAIQLKDYEPALKYGAATSITTAQTITDSTNGAFAVGANGATNPVFNIDASTASVATGINLKGAAAAGGMAVSVTSSGTDEALKIDAKGAGTITLGGTSTGNIVLSRAVQQKANVISGSGATVTLTAAQSGSVVLLDRAAGIVFTLPVPAVGLYYDFLASASVTSNSYKVITDAGTTLLIGSLINIDTDTGNAVAAWTGNGSTHIAVTMNGTTTGGLIGTAFRFTCVSATQWMVSGIDQGNGTVATPFATS